jgi:glycerol uptake operon antiterminator
LPSRHLISQLRAAPIIVAIRDPKEMAAAVASPSPVVFLLACDIGTVAGLVAAIHARGKKAFVHFDLVGGLGKDLPALRWLAETARPEGIITTRGPVVGQARSLGMLTVLRTFLLDSQSLVVAVEQTRKSGPDFLEVMPGIAPEGIRMLVGQVECPVIAGGLVRTVPQVKAAMVAGALAISTSAEKLWQHSFVG